MCVEACSSQMVSPPTGASSWVMRGMERHRRPTLRCTHQKFRSMLRGDSSSRFSRSLNRRRTFDTAEVDLRHCNITAQDAHKVSTGAPKFPIADRSKRTPGWMNHVLDQMSQFAVLLRQYLNRLCSAWLAGCAAATVIMGVTCTCDSEEGNWLTVNITLASCRLAQAERGH